MPPLVLLEIAYKVMWLILVAYPLWSTNQLAGSLAEGTATRAGGAELATDRSLARLGAVGALVGALLLFLSTLLGNGIGGMVFGWLYWKRGLIAAVTAHFAADIVLYVMAPVISSM